jgi:hypothetical protein
VAVAVAVAVAYILVRRAIMASEIFLTDGVFRATATLLEQPLAQAVDVSNYDQLDLLLHVAGFEGTPTGFVVSIISGMNMETNDGWVVMPTSFNGVITPNGTAILNVPRLFKYVRFRVTTLTGASAVYFTIRGMARKN